MKFTLVLKNSFFYTIAIALQGMISFFLLPVYTKYLLPSDYAILALVNSFIGIVSSIVTLQIHNGIPVFVIKFLKDEERAKKYFTSIFLLLGIILLLSCFFIELFGDRLIKFMFLNKDGIAYAPYFRIATWTLLPTLLIGCALLLLQTLERGNKYFIVVLIQVVLSVSLGLFFVVFLKAGVVGVLWAQCIGAICGLGFVVWLVRDWLTWFLPKFPLKDIKDSLRYSIPIIPHILSIYIYMYSDRLILQRYVPLSDIGIYSIADTFAYVLLVIANATTSAYSPRFFKLAEQDVKTCQEETKNFIGIWWIGIMVIFMGYLLLSGYIVKLLTRPSFYASIPLIPILATAYLFRGLYCFALNGIAFVRKTALIPVITITAAGLNIGCNLVFIPKFGIYAASWSTVASYLTTFILAYYFSKRYFPVLFPWKQIGKVIVVSLVFYIVIEHINRISHFGLHTGFVMNCIMLSLFALTTVFCLYRNKAFVLLKASWEGLTT